MKISEKIFSSLHHRQQLSSPAGGHKPGVVVIVGVEILVGWYADEDDGFGVEAFGFVNGGVADGAGGVLLFGAFSEVAAHKHTAIPDRTFGDVGLGVEDEHIRRIAKAGIFPTKEDGFHEVGGIRASGKWVDFGLRAFGELIPAAERLDHACGDRARVIVEELP